MDGTSALLHGIHFPLTSLDLILCTKVTDIMDRSTGLPRTTWILCLFCNQENSAIISADAFSYHNRELSHIQKTAN